MKTIRVSAPATVSNVCCGFDVLGFAVHEPADEVIVTITNGPLDISITDIIGDGGRLPWDTGRNTASVAVQSLLRAYQVEATVGLSLVKNLPLGSGMGSSGASAVAALVGVNKLLALGLSRSNLIEHAMFAETVACGASHADNVAPALMGGFVAIRSYQPLEVISVPVALPLYCTLVHPQLEVRTEDARKALAETVPLKNVVTQNGNMAGLMVGLMQGDAALIGRSLQDVIAEPVRAQFLPDLYSMKSIALENGALGAGISGSGPTMFALSTEEAAALRVGSALQQHFADHALPSECYVSRINPDGAKVIE